MNVNISKPIERARHVSHPHAVPVLDSEDTYGTDAMPDIDSDVRYRMISEAAYHRYLDRGCVEGFDVDDWLAAEADVERELRTETSVET